MKRIAGALGLALIVLLSWSCLHDDGGNGKGVTAAATLVIEDEYVGQWMPINNAWAFPDPNNRTHDWKRNGIVIQVGDFWKFRDENGRKRRTSTDLSFREIEIEFDDGTSATWSSGEFVWVDIDGSPGNSVRPLPDDWYKNLLPVAGKDPMCSWADDCGQEGTVSTLDCSADVDDLLRPCLRRRTIHAWLDTKGIVTYWQGPRGYTMDASVQGNLGAEHAGHARWSFDLIDRVDVTVHKPDGTCVTYGKHPGTCEGVDREVKKVMLREHPPGNFHGDIHDPPLGGP